MNLQDKKEHSANRLNQVRRAIDEIQEKALRIDELQEMKRAFHQNLGLAAIGEMKFDRRKAFQELQTAERNRTLDTMTIESLETMERAAATAARDADAELECATRKFNFLSEKVTAILDSNYFDEMEILAPGKRESVYSDVNRVMYFKAQVRELQDLSESLGRDAMDILKKAAPILAT